MVCLDGDNNKSLDYTITKGGAVSPPTSDNTPSDDISTFTGETRKSKANAYVTIESKQVTAQYAGNIGQLDHRLDDNGRQVLNLNSQLEDFLKTLVTATDVLTSILPLSIIGYLVS